MSPASSARRGASWRSANLTKRATSRGLSDVYIQGRIEVLRQDPRATILLDIDGLILWAWKGPHPYLSVYIREDKLEGGSR